jgi:hypothetical protein
MVTESSRISLPLAVGVDCGHPQATGGGSRPPLVAGSFFFFFWVGSPERHMAIEGGRISPPSRRGGSRPPPVARSIFFFFFFCSPESHRRWAAGDDEWRQVVASVAEGG